jgi:glycosyltransferase involved in cell wall biosynthesis
MTAVSFLCTVKNGGDLFMETLKSIRNQTFRNFELVVVDDGSTDRTNERIRKFANENRFPVTLVTTKGVGRGRALNLGVEHCKGTYIMIVDDDDPIHPEKARIQHEAGRSNPEYTVLCTRAFTLLNEDEPEWREISETGEDPLDVTDRVYIKNPVIHSSVMIRKEALEAEGAYDETRKSQFDTELWLRLVTNGHRIGQIPYALTAKRAHRNQAFERKKRLAFLTRTTALQLKYLKKAGMPPYYYVFPAAKFAYGLLPRAVRVQLRKSREQV